MWYYVEYNGKLLKATKTKGAALSFINHKGLRDDDANSLVLVDNYGDMYDPVTGADVVPDAFCSRDIY